MSILHTIKKAFYKKGLLGAIAKNAIIQFGKWQKKFPDMSEAEIAQGMFDLRYTRGFFSAMQKAKIVQYIESKMQMRTLLYFCLASLDIEGNINPRDGKTFDQTAAMLEDILDDLGYQKDFALHKDAFKSAGMTNSSRVLKYSIDYFDKILGFTNPINFNI